MAGGGVSEGNDLRGGVLGLRRMREGVGRCCCIRIHIPQICTLNKGMFLLLRLWQDSRIICACSFVSFFACSTQIESLREDRLFGEVRITVAERDGVPESKCIDFPFHTA